MRHRTQRAVLLRREDIANIAAVAGIGLGVVMRFVTTEAVKPGELTVFFKMLDGRPLD